MREKFSIVAQDVVIFNKSIAENIQYADPKASAEAVRAAASVAFAKYAKALAAVTP